MKKEDWLDKLAYELPGLSPRTRNAMQRKCSTVKDLIKDFDNLKPLRFGGPPSRKTLSWGAGKKAVRELRKSLKDLGFNREDHILLSDNPNEFTICDLQDKYSLSRKQAECFTDIAIKEGLISPPLFED